MITLLAFCFYFRNSPFMRVARTLRRTKMLNFIAPSIISVKRTSNL